METLVNFNAKKENDGVSLELCGNIASPLTPLVNLCRSVMDLRTHLTRVKMDLATLVASIDDLSSAKSSLKQELQDFDLRKEQISASTQSVQLQIQSDTVTHELLENELKGLQEELKLMVRCSSGYAVLFDFST